MTWGQFLGHDVTLTELPEGLDCGINNAPCNTIPGCVNIKIPNGLELLFNESVQCIPLSRSVRNAAGDQALFTQFRRQAHKGKVYESCPHENDTCSARYN
ncbi:unnamed protein product [Porites lobata]|uniref:Peroxidase n=1 Tax=Porites lobata TaxID=104759 RepID=A0ABN8QA49_9CNID|nr:unnamed protein product [Porites lobata]